MSLCNLCKSDGFWIKEYKYWNFGIGSYQHTLGSSVIVLKQHKELFSELTEEEILELRKIIQDAQRILDAEFKPDWYNVQQNGNWEPHLHVHVIPRYKDKKLFENREFVDKSYGQPVVYSTKQETQEFLKNFF